MTDLYDSVTAFRGGDRVELHPGTDAWAMGDRYGTVAHVGRKNLHVRMDRSRRMLRVAPCAIYAIHEGS